jgi:hypothetical protein
MRLLSRAASSTSQSQISDRAEFGDYNRVGLADQVAKASLPGLATGDAFAIDDTFEAAKIKRRGELIGEVEVFAAVGNKDAKLPFVGGSRPAG